MDGINGLLKDEWANPVGLQSTQYADQVALHESHCGPSNIPYTRAHFLPLLSLVQLLVLGTQLLDSRIFWFVIVSFPFFPFKKSKEICNGPHKLCFSSFHNRLYTRRPTALPLFRRHFAHLSQSWALPRC